MKNLSLFDEILQQVKELVMTIEKKAVLIIQQNPNNKSTELFRVSAIRESISNIICIVSVIDDSCIEHILTVSKNVIDLVILDTDNKRDNSCSIIDKVNLIAKQNNITIASYSDFETWSIAAVNFLIENEDKREPKILIIGKNQLSSHIIFDLISRNAKISLLKREYPDNEINIVFDNNNTLLLSSNSISLVEESENLTFDAVMGCSIMENSPFLDNIECINAKNYYDIGLNNFSEHFIEIKKLQGSNFYRSDDHAGISSMIINILETKFLVHNNLASINFAGLSVVSGGVIGANGDIVVDNANNPTTIFGVANGQGLFKTKLNEEDIKKLNKIKYLLS